MKKPWMRLLCGAAMLLGMTSAHAVYTITVTEVGSNVVMSGSGQINTTGMTLSSGSSYYCGGGGRWPGGGNTLCVGADPAGAIVNSAITAGGVPVMGTGGATSGSSSTGSAVFLASTSLYLPAGYVSNASMSGSTTFNNKTLATLGATVGSYTMTLSSGDTIVVNVTAATPVPTLGTAGKLAFALLLLTGGYVALQRRRS